MEIGWSFMITINVTWPFLSWFQVPDQGDYEEDIDCHKPWFARFILCPAPILPMQPAMNKTILISSIWQAKTADKWPILAIPIPKIHGRYRCWDFKPCLKFSWLVGRPTTLVMKSNLVLPRWRTLNSLIPGKG